MDDVNIDWGLVWDEVFWEWGSLGESFYNLRDYDLELLVVDLDVGNFPLLNHPPNDPRFCGAVVAPLDGCLLSEGSLA